MELHQLRYFVAVADESSFTRAAARLHVSQSGVSAQVAQLERELGQPLLDRAGRRVTLTEAGHAVLPHARSALAGVDAVRQSADEVAGLVRGQVRLGMVTGCSMPPLIAGLADLHAAHPGLVVSLGEDLSDRLQRGVVDGDLDAALVGFVGDPLPGLVVATFVDEALVAAVPGGHPLAGRARLAPADLAPHAVVTLPLGTGVRAAYDAARGGVATPAIEASSPDTVLALAARGLGVAVVSASMADRDALVAVPLRTPGVSARLGLVWREREPVTPATRVLVETLCRAFGAGPPSDD